MNWNSRRLQVVGSCFVGLLLLVGGYFLYQDLCSLVREKQSYLERTVLAASHMLAVEPLEQALQTKDSQSAFDSQLQDRLFELAQQLNLTGPLSLIDMRSTIPSVIASTRPGLRKGDAYNIPSDFKADRAGSGPLQREHSRFEILAYAPVLGPQGQSLAVMVHEAEASSFFYRLIGYGLHYLLLAVGLVTIGGFLFIWNTIRTSRQLENLRSTFLHLMREASDGVIIVDEKLRIMRANDSALILLQQNFDLLKGKLVGAGNDGVIIVPLDQNKDPIRKCLQTGERTRCRAKLVLNSDQTIYIQLSVSPVYEGGKIRGASLLIKDISDDLIREQELLYTQSSVQEVKGLHDLGVISDSATHCLNRNYLNYFLEWERLKWFGYEGCSMVMVSIGNLPVFLAAHGSQPQEQVLRNFAAFLKTFFRRADKVIRFNENEFVVLLPQTDLTATQRIAQNLLDALAKQKDNPSLEINIGLAELQPKELGHDWLNRTQSALERSRRSGANHLQANDLTQLEVLN